MRASAVVEVLLGHVDAKVAIHGGENVLRMHGSFLGLGSLGIGSSHDATALNTTTGDRGAEYAFDGRGLGVVGSRADGSVVGHISHITVGISRTRGTRA